MLTTWAGVKTKSAKKKRQGDQNLVAKTIVKMSNQNKSKSQDSQMDVCTMTSLTTWWKKM